MNDQERQDLTALLMEATPEQLDTIHGGLKQTLTSLEDLNTAFPATQEFLRARGLTHMRQLDAAGRKELQLHLEGVLKSLCKGSA